MGHFTVSSDYEEARKLLTPDKLAVVVMGAPRRIGGKAFLTFMEDRHFSPLNGKLNALWTLFFLRWEGMIFHVAVYPREYRRHAEQVCQELGLRLADGVPTILDGSGIKRFPLDQPNVWTFEHVPGHFVFKNNPVEGKTAEQYEDEACEKIHARWAEELDEIRRQGL